MKLLNLTIAVALVTTALPLRAQSRLVEFLEEQSAPSSTSRTVGELIQRMRAESGASVIDVDWSTNSFIIPVAGNTAGGGGTYFRSDVVFNNDRLQDQRVAIGWLAQGANNCSAPLQYFTLSANSVIVADDFVNRSLGKTGIGAVLVVSVRADGSFDTNGEIDGYSRIWTPQPGSSGTVSQNFNAISVQDSLGSLTATLMGLKQSSQFRTNVGVVNMDNVSPHTWTFTSIFNGVTTSLSVPPCSMVQASVANGSASASGNLAFSVKSNGFGFYWSGFGSTTDNVTGDGWVSRAIQ